MFTTKEIREMCSLYRVNCDEIGEVIDTTKDKNDQRYNYFIDNQYILKISNSEVIYEENMKEIQSLIQRYNEMGIYCPKLYQTEKGEFTGTYSKNEITYIFYLEEKSKYQSKKETRFVDYNFKKQILRHVGRHAAINSNRELIETKSMWSIIELSPYDEEIDEKQENFNALIKCLEEEKQNDLAKELSDLNEKAREKIINYMDKLPRCVFQGDLNDSNILVDENGDFQGLIDFNMFGTEVNINYFLNEAMYYFTKKTL